MTIQERDKRGGHEDSQEREDKSHLISIFWPPITQAIFRHFQELFVPLHCFIFLMALNTMHSASGHSASGHIVSMQIPSEFIQ